MNTIEKNLLSHAKEHIAVVNKQSQDLVPLEQKITQEVEEDYSLSREKIKGLIDKSEEAIDRLMDLASQTEHPRAFEVLSQMIKNTSDMAIDLNTLQEKRKKLHQKESSSSSITGNTTTNNNTIFVGSTTDLQKFLASEKEKVINLNHAETDSQ